MKNSVILSHAGKQHAYHVAKALNDLQSLDKFFTSSYIALPWLQNLVLRSRNTFWSKRFLAGLGGKKVESHWRFELKEILLGKIYGQSEKTLNAVYERDMQFDKTIARKLGNQKGNIFWGFQGSCHESLAAASSLGKKTICELATGHVAASLKILGEEKKLQPDWADSFDNLHFPPEYLLRLEQEPHRADVVIGASHFTLKTLQDDGVDKSKLKYLPLGFELDHIPFPENKVTRNSPLKLLFAGRVTQRKGIAYLLEAMRSFNRRDVELHIIGFVQGSGAGLEKHKGNFTLHPPVSQYELFKLYQKFDALLLPSLFEGFGLVILEAMAAGLPVITTPNSIGPELITHGKDGFIVPIRNVEAIRDAVMVLLNSTPEQRSEMRHAARAKANGYSWDAYRNRLETLLASI